MKTRSSPHRTRVILCAFIVACLSVPMLHAAPASEGSTQDQVIRLEEFTVAEGRVDGYRAVNSITATGIGARIMDVPIAINIQTKEYLQDTAITELREALATVPGVLTTPRNESEYTVRGFGGNITYRNGQYRRQNISSWNLERVEVVKGPAAIFFGNVRPGGIVNYITGRPVLNKKFTDVSVSVGSEDHYRGSVYANIPYSDTIAVRVGWGGLSTKGKGAYEFRRESYYGGSVTWKPNESHQLTLDAEKLTRSNFMPSSRGYAVTHSDFHGNPAVPAFTLPRAWLNSQGRNTTPAYNMYAPIYPANDPYGRYYAYSPDSIEDFMSTAIDLDYLWKVTDSIVWQTQLNYSYDEQPGLRSNNGDQTPFADGTVRFRFEQWNNIRDAYNAKNKLTWKFNLGETSHTLQMGYEYQKVVFNKPGFYDANKRYNGSLLSNVITFKPATDTPLYGFNEIAKSGQYFNITRRRDEIAEGVLMVMQSRLFKEKVHLLYGARYNYLSADVSYDQPVTNPDTAIGTPKGWTPQFGVSYKPRRDISLFVVNSKSIEPNFAIDADGNTALPIETVGWDVGMKTELLDGRVALNLGFFTLDRTNISTRDTEKETLTGRTPFYFFGNTHTSKGIEADFNLSPLENYQLIFGWNHFLKAEVTESSTASLIGNRFSYTPENTYSIWNRYRFKDGPLAGVAVGLGARYADEARMSNNAEYVVVVPSYHVIDGMISRDMKMFERRVKAQLNVKNVTDEVYRSGPNGMFGPPRSFMLTMSTQF